MGKRLNYQQKKLTKADKLERMLNKRQDVGG